jgi:hypothetical protein
MTFIKFINEYVDDEKFKTAINALHDVWLRNEGKSQFESAVTIQQPQTISTANTQQQNQVIANANQQQQQPQQQQNKVEPRTVQGDLNNLDSQKMMSLAARFQEIEKQKEANQKAAADAQKKLDSELDEVQNTVNAALNGKMDNIVG